MYNCIYTIISGFYVTLESALSVLVTVDISHPHGLPECQFMGADHLVEPLIKIFANNIDVSTNS